MHKKKYLYHHYRTGRLSFYIYIRIRNYLEYLEIVFHQRDFSTHTSIAVHIFVYLVAVFDQYFVEYILYCLYILVLISSISEVHQGRCNRTSQSIFNLNHLYTNIPSDYQIGYLC